MFSAAVVIGALRVKSQLNWKMSKQDRHHCGKIVESDIKSE